LEIAGTPQVNEAAVAPGDVLEKGVIRPTVASDFFALIRLGIGEQLFEKNRQCAKQVLADVMQVKRSHGSQRWNFEALGVLDRALESVRVCSEKLLVLNEEGVLA
jgi:hypothetical protein